MGRISASYVVVGSAFCLVLGPIRLCALPPPIGDDPVLATVGDQPITRAEAQRMLQRAVGAQPVDPALLPVLQAQVLAEIVDRHLVLAYARRTNAGPSEAEIDAALGELKARIIARGETLERYLGERSMSEADLRRQITWELTWDRLFDRYATQQRLEAHFAAHRREFDGTQIAVSHILLRPNKADDPKATDPKTVDPKAIDKLVAEARTLREKIASGQLAFEEAARKYSAGPSATQGGKLGFIGRRGPMVESFSRAAFALEPGQVSQPVVTRFGVHLIRCDEIAPGTRQLADVRSEVEASLARELLENLARFEEKSTPVTFTGLWPHFQPGTREVASP